MSKIKNNIRLSFCLKNTCKKGHLNMNARHSGWKLRQKWLVKINFSQPLRKKVLLFWSFYYYGFLLNKNPWSPPYGLVFWNFFTIMEFECMYVLCIYGLQNAIHRVTLHNPLITFIITFIIPWISRCTCNLTYSIDVVGSSTINQACQGITFSELYTYNVCCVHL